MLCRSIICLLLVLATCACSEGNAVETISNPALNLPSPSALLKDLPKRKVKSTEAEVARTGSQFEASLFNQRAAVQGSSVVLSPQFNPPLTGTTGDLACALYRFDLSTYDRDNTLRLKWSTPNAASQTWIGLANMSKDRWEWHACPFNNVLDFTDAAAYTAPGGDAV